MICVYDKSFGGYVKMYLNTSHDSSVKKMQIGISTNFAQHSKYTLKEKRRGKRKIFTIEYNNNRNNNKMT